MVRSSRTRSGRSAWTHCSRGSDLLRPRPALLPARLGPRPVLPRGDRWPGPRGGHDEAGSWPASRRRARRTRRTAWRRSRSTSAIRCSGSSGRATRCGHFADVRGRGFLMGATAGRTALTARGTSTMTNTARSCPPPSQRALLRPAFAYEPAAVIRDGIERMHGRKPEDVFYYVTIYNENYAQPNRPDGLTDEEILAGIYRFARGAGCRARTRIRSGSSVPGRSSSRCSPRATSWPKVRRRRRGRAALRRSRCCAATCSTQRANRSTGAKSLPVPYVSKILPHQGGPLIAATDWMKALPAWSALAAAALRRPRHGRLRPQRYP